ncbi:MAG: DNA-directed RNA polymerase subunit omega [Verrucomicrobiota bacterium]|nr:DNA-directed RNA polymerase subunit omega [Verrucomicrobiota bacterium]
MDPILLASATKAIPATELLVNVVRLRVRQLVAGHRPLVMVPPGMGLCDVALSEIGAGKLTSESSIAADALPAPILLFPTVTAKRKAA